MNATPNKEFQQAAAAASRDATQRGRIAKALSGYYVKRDETRDRFRDWQGARTCAAAIKDDAIARLDTLVEQFATNIESHGAKVHWCPDAQSARDAILQIAADNKVRTVVKSKSMTSEEIHLNPALEKAGVDVLETDLGEFIMQLLGEPPFHIVFPAMHLDRGQISDLFKEKLGEPAAHSSPEELTLIARRVMRQKFCEADMGISGANFGIADIGAVSITENEGNARLATSLPRIHVVLMGIEKILPRMEDLALFLPMLAAAGAGQLITGYNTLISGPRAVGGNGGDGESDGPEQMHVVLLDNRRTALLADPAQRNALDCIRCGSCLNVCPVYKSIGGHSYGTTYSGPIGAAITPALCGLQEWKHLDYACSLCGACSEICPVKIDLHQHLLINRRTATQAKQAWWERYAYKAYAFLMRRQPLYTLAIKIGRLAQKFHSLINNTVLDPVRAWTSVRSFPKLAPRSFHEMWRERERNKSLRLLVPRDKEPEVLVTIERKNP